MAGEAMGPAVITVASGVFLGVLAYLGGRSNSKDASTTSLYLGEQKARAECEKTLRDYQAQHHAEMERVENERDAQRQRADLLEVENERLKAVHRRS